MDIASTTSPSIGFQNRQLVDPSANAERQAPAQIAPKTETVQQAQPSQISTEQAIQKVNDALQQKQKDLFAAIEKDKITGISIFKIMDKSTNEVIRQLPTKEVVSFAQSLELPQGWRGQLIMDQI